MDIKGLQARIQKRLDALGESPEAVSKAAGLGRDAIRNIMRGRSQHPTSRTIEGLARELHCDINWLMNGDGRPEMTATRDDEIELLRRYRAMTTEQRAGALGMVRLIDVSDTRKTRD